MCALVRIFIRCAVREVASLLSFPSVIPGHAFLSDISSGGLEDRSSAAPSTPWGLRNLMSSSSTQAKLFVSASSSSPSPTCCFLLSRISSPPPASPSHKAVSGKPTKMTHAFRAASFSDCPIYAYRQDLRTTTPRSAETELPLD